MKSKSKCVLWCYQCFGYVRACWGGCYSFLEMKRQEMPSACPASQLLSTSSRHTHYYPLLFPTLFSVFLCGCLLELLCPWPRISWYLHLSPIWVQQMPDIMMLDCVLSARIVRWFDKTQSVTSDCISSNLSPPFPCVFSVAPGVQTSKNMSW